MLLIRCLLFAHCGLDAISFLGRKEETVYEPSEQRTLLMTPPVTTVPIAGPTMVPTGTIPERDAGVVLNANCSC